MPCSTGNASSSILTICSMTSAGRASRALVVAVVMVLQRLEGLSDREAVERSTFDVPYKCAAGVWAFDDPGFAHTVLVDMRARARPLRASQPDLQAVAAGRP